MSYLKAWQRVRGAVARLRARFLQGTTRAEQPIVNDGMLFMMNSDVIPPRLGEPVTRGDVALSGDPL
jgi:hypothetical protein